MSPSIQTVEGNDNHVRKNIVAPSSNVFLACIGEALEAIDCDIRAGDRMALTGKVTTKSLIRLHHAVSTTVKIGPPSAYDFFCWTAVRPELESWLHEALYLAMSRVYEQDVLDYCNEHWVDKETTINTWLRLLLRHATGFDEWDEMTETASDTEDGSS